MGNEKFGHQNPPEVQSPIEDREKYWGRIINICKLDNCTLKVIEMKKGFQSSMEFHTKKEETYFIQKGKLKLGLRVGRGENKSVVLNTGDVYHIPVGLMHMRMALEDTVIIELATNDTDEDSHIVEDGNAYEFKEGK